MSKTNRRRKRSVRSSRTRHAQRSQGPNRRAIVLIIVLVVVTVLSLGAYTFSSLMLTHREAVKLNGQRLQTRMLVDSGVELVNQYLKQDEATREEMGGAFDNPGMFQGVTVLPAADLLSRGSFCILSPFPDDTQMAAQSAGIRYGLEDESIRLNLNLLLLADQLQQGASRNLLMGIPGMTESAADGILDWIDEDDDPREYGAEADYYIRLDPPYEPQNGPPTTIEELLRVRDVTPELLFGLDQNRNGIVDAHESGMTAGATMGATAAAATGSSGPLTAADTGFPDRGWSAYLTLYSAERNTSADGLPRINLNNSDLQALYDELSEVFSPEWTNYICAYRLYGPTDDDEGDQQQGGGAAGGNQQEIDPGTLELDLEQSPRAEFTQVLDLIGKRVQISSDGNDQGQNQTIGSPFPNSPFEMASFLPQLMDMCTVSDAPMIPGRININQAPPEILAGIPGMTEEILQGILDSRQLAQDVGISANRDHETWLVTESIVSLDQMRALLPFITAGGDVFRSQIIGYFQGGGASTRVELVFDATDVEPRILFWRDLSHLGRGFALQTLGVELASDLQ